MEPGSAGGLSVLPFHLTHVAIKFSLCSPRQSNSSVLKEHRNNFSSLHLGRSFFDLESCLFLGYETSSLRFLHLGKSLVTVYFTENILSNLGCPERPFDPKCKVSSQNQNQYVCGGVRNLNTFRRTDRDSLCKR